MKKNTDVYLFVFWDDIRTFQFRAFIIDAAMKEVINWIDNIIQKLSTVDGDFAIGHQWSGCNSIAENENPNDDKEYRKIIGLQRQGNST